MAKKEKSKYVVEIIMSQEERDKYAQNPPKRGNLKNWDGKGRVYAKKNTICHTNTLDLNDATCYNKLEDAQYFAETITFLDFYGYSARVIEIKEVKQEVGFATQVFKPRRDRE